MSTNPEKNNLQGESSGNLHLDNAAFEAFFKKHFIPLCSYCQYKFGFDLDQAKEIVHIGFIRLWEVCQTSTKDLSPKAYLYRIIINSSLDVLKHRKIKQQHITFVQKTTSEESPANSFESIDYKQLRTDIDAAISELPEQMRQIFELSRFEGLKYAQIAAQLNISVKTVETQMSRALAKLRGKLAGYLNFNIILLILSLLGKK